MSDPNPDAVDDPDPTFEATVREGVCRLRRPGARWLSTGHDGGESRADAAYLVSVPEGWDDVEIGAYVARRRREAGFADAAAPESDADGEAEAAPALLTGVSMRHARRARLGPVEAVVTAGLSNPAGLPVPVGGDDEDRPGPGDADAERRTGTVNVVVGTTRSLAPGALANLVAVAAEAKAATLLARTGFPGTTSDAVLAACDPAGERAAFSGSATAVGSAARACVRDALLAALDSRYQGEEPPESVEDAAYGVVTDRRAAVGSISGDSGGG